MFAKQSSQFPDEWKNFISSMREMPSLKDHEDFKAVMDKRYKKAQRAVCRSLIASYEEKFLLQNKSSLN